jgi:hypothetical protein
MTDQPQSSLPATMITVKEYFSDTKHQTREFVDFFVNGIEQVLSKTKKEKAIISVDFDKIDSIKFNVRDSNDVEFDAEQIKTLFLNNTGHKFISPYLVYDKDFNFDTLAEPDQAGYLLNNIKSSDTSPVTLFTVIPVYYNKDKISSTSVDTDKIINGSIKYVRSGIAIYLLHKYVWSNKAQRKLTIYTHLLQSLNIILQQHISQN